MNKLISAYLWAWKDIESGTKSVKSFLKFYPDATVYINVDYEGDNDYYKKLAEEINGVYTRNNFQVGYCGNGWIIQNNRDCWPPENAFEWVRGLYEACLKSESKYMLILEEDDFVLSPISLLQTDFSMAIHASMPSAAGNWRPNFLPNEFMLFSADLGGVASAPGYGAGGGCIFNRLQFIESWEKAKQPIWDNYERLSRINKIIGWQDFLVQFIMMIGGYEITQHFRIAQPWEHPNWPTEPNCYGEPYEMVCGLKNHSMITL